MPDWNTKEVKSELTQLIDQVQKKYHVRSEVMHFILSELAKDYEMKTLGEKVLHGENQ